MRLIVASWRHATAQHHGRLIRDKLTPFWLRYQTAVTLVHGQCPLGGGDLICEHIALGWGWHVERHPATGHPTEDFGPWPAAGPRRNGHMVRLGADEVCAFPKAGGRGKGGTWDLIHAAADAGIPGRWWPLPVPGRSR